MVLAAPFALVSAYSVGIATASVDVAAMGSLLVPALALCALGAAAARWGGAQGLAALFAGLMYGEVLGHVLLRLFPNAVFVALDHIPLCALACAAVFVSGLALIHLLARREASDPLVERADDVEQGYEIQDAWRLSEREREAVMHALEGTSSRAASESMGISASTVRQAIKDGNCEALKELVPKTTLDYFMSPQAEAVIARIRGEENVVHY